MVPMTLAIRQLKDFKNNNEASFIVREVKGSAYAFLTVEPGANYSIVVIMVNKVTLG